MKSIWSKNYMTFKTSNPFSKFEAKKETVNLPNTNGMKKTIDSERLLNENSTNKSKRKLQKNDSDIEGSEEGKENKKKIKMNDIRVDLDCLLDDYSSIKSKNTEIESSSESSGYFSSNSGQVQSSLGSPVINKPSQLLNQLNQDEENKSPKSNTVSILERYIEYILNSFLNLFDSLVWKLILNMNKNSNLKY